VEMNRYSHAVDHDERKDAFTAVSFIAWKTLFSQCVALA